MKIKLHLTLMIAGEVASFVAGFAISYAWVEASRGDSWALYLLKMVVPWLSLNTLVNVIFRYVLPARCPRDGCGNKCFPTGTRPIIYKCRVCDFKDRTRVSTG